MYIIFLLTVIKKEYTHLTPCTDLLGTVQLKKVYAEFVISM